MNRTFVIKSLLVAAVALPMAHAAKRSSRDDQAAAYHRVRADYRADRAACGSQTVAARAICIEHARVRRALAEADLESGSAARAAASTM